MAKTFPLLLLTLLCAEVIYAETNPTLDGSRYYGLPDKSVEVELVTCPDGYQSFKGIWTGDKFMVGERVDTYPEYNGLPSKIESSMLITGTTSGDNARPFLRTVDKENGLIEYHKVFEDKPSEMSVWEYQRVRKKISPR